jgi:hypothetical protein
MRRYCNGDIPCEENECGNLSIVTAKEEKFATRNTVEESLAVGIGWLNAKVLQEMG